MFQIEMTIFVIGAAAIMSFVGVKLSQKDPVLESVLAAIGILLLVWIPQPARDILLLICLFLFAFSAMEIGVLGSLLTVGFFGLISSFIPGGVSVVVFGLIIIMAISEILEAIHHQKRLLEAKKLEPGKIPSGEVALSVTLHETKMTNSPQEDIHCIAWKLRANSEDKQSQETILATSINGPVLIDFANANLSFCNHSLELKGEEAKTLAKKAEISFKETPEEISVTFKYIGKNNTLYVVGSLTWVEHPSGASGYRNSSLVPKFSSTEKKKIYISDQTEAEVKRNAIWQLVWWLGLCVSMSIVLVIQIIY